MQWAHTKPYNKRGHSYPCFKDAKTEARQDEVISEVFYCAVMKSGHASVCVHYFPPSPYRAVLK